MHGLLMPLNLQARLEADCAAHCDPRELIAPHLPMRRGVNRSTCGAKTPSARQLAWVENHGAAMQRAHMRAVAVFLSSLGLPRRGAVRGADDRRADVEAVANGRFCALRRADQSTSTRMLRGGMARRRWGGVLKAQAAIAAGRRRASEPRCWDGEH